MEVPLKKASNKAKHVALINFFVYLVGVIEFTYTSILYKDYLNSYFIVHM